MISTPDWMSRLLMGWNRRIQTNSTPWETSKGQPSSTLVKLVSWLVGALSPVNHKGLHQGWIQTSLYLQVIHFTSHQTTSHVFFSLSIFRGHSTREPASSRVTYFILRALNTGTCIQQGDLFYSAGLHRNHVSATAKTGEIGRGFGKNAGEWTGRVEISKEEIPGSKRSMYGYILKGERLSSVFSPDGTLISASAAPHCGASWLRDWRVS